MAGIFLKSSGIKVVLLTSGGTFHKIFSDAHNNPGCLNYP